MGPRSDVDIHTIEISVANYAAQGGGLIADAGQPLNVQTSAQLNSLQSHWMLRIIALDLGPIGSNNMER